MYTPDLFRIDDRDHVDNLIAANSFATLVTVDAGAPVATHIPFYFDPGLGTLGQLSTHIARANPQWKQFGDAEVLVIFQGAHAYISPSWYASDMMVPTWNYDAVHVYGRPRIVDDAGLQAILARTVDQYESGREKPWTMEMLPADFVEKLRRAFVGIEIEITRVEGKSKMSQNRSSADQLGAIAGLMDAADPLSLAVAEIMKANLSIDELG